MRTALWILVGLMAVFCQGCASPQGPMDSTRYNAAVEKQFNEEYADRLKQ